MRRTVLALDGGHPGQMDLLHDHFEILRPSKPDPEQVIRENAETIQAVTTFLTPVSRFLIEALPNLEIIAVGAVGLDHIDLEAAKERGIVVTHTPDVLTDDTADVAMLHILNLARRAVEGDAYVRAGLWLNGPLPLGISLSGKTAGIVGLGRIGHAVAKRAEAFGMTVAYHGPSGKKNVAYDYHEDIASLAAASDFFVLSCSGGGETEALVNYEILEALGPGAYIINIARGSVINQEDLLVALRNKTIAGAGLDVYENEPKVPEELITMDNVVLTPHIGSATLETRRRMGQIVAGNLIAHFEGQALLTPVEI